MKKGKLLSLVLALSMIMTQLALPGWVSAASENLPAALTGRENFLKGVNIHNNDQAEYANTYSALRDAKDLGSNIVRFNCDPGPSGFTADLISYIKSTADIAHQLDMKVMLVLDGFNQFLKDSDGNLITDENDLATDSISDVYSNLASELEGKIDYYQIGNEIDNMYLSSGASDGSSTAQYSNLAVPAAAIIAATDALSVSGTAETVINFGWLHYGFLEGIKANGATWDITGLDWYSKESYNTHHEPDYTDIINEGKKYSKSRKVIVCETGLTPNDEGSETEVSYIGDAEWLTKFVTDSHSNADVLGIIIYELYDEASRELDENGAWSSYNREAHFGLYDKNGNEKSVTPYIRSLFGGKASERIENPTIPDVSYGADAVEIDKNGMMTELGKTFLYTADRLIKTGLSLDLSRVSSVEFDLYVEDYDSFMAAYNNARFNETGARSAFRFRLRNSAGSVTADDFDINQVTQSGWNKITIEKSRFGAFDFSNITEYNIYFEQNNGLWNNQWLNAAAGMKFGIANVYGVRGEADSIPEPSSDYQIVGSPLSSNAVDTTWADYGDQVFVITQDKVRQLGCRDTTVIKTDWSKADQIEFDIYIENYEHFRHPFDNTPKGYGISNLRLSLELYNQNDWNGDGKDVYANFDQIEQYITKSGWNHVVLPKSKFEIVNGCDFTEIQAWRLKFGGYYCTWKFSDLGAAELATERVVVANFIGSKFMPEPTSENTIIGYPLSSNAVDTTWADNGDQLFVITQDRVRQLGTAISTANDWSKADYIEFDIYIENYEHFRHPFDNTPKGYGISNLRLSLELYNQNDWNGDGKDVYANFDQIEQYITKSGWNHVVLPKSKFEIVNGCDFTEIQAWRLKFGGYYCTWKFSDLGAAELATERVVVANFIGTTAAEKGDVNGDKFVDIRDLVHLKKYLAKVEGVTVVEAAADMNGDNKVTSEDLVELRKYLLTK